MFKSKTFWTGLAGLVTAAGGAYTGALSPVEAAQMGLTSALAMFLRQGIAKEAARD